MNLRHRHESIQNPKIPLQRRLNPIRNRRAPEVFFYLWCRGVPINPLYEVGSGRVGCWISPAMLESEWAIVKEFHPRSPGTMGGCTAGARIISQIILHGGIMEMAQPAPKGKDVCRDPRDRPSLTGG
ncbi:MAG: phosphoadenosine phosphosulfate reductase domain-containing protein [Methanoculleaceae archaeon]